MPTRSTRAAIATLYAPSRMTVVQLASTIGALFLIVVLMSTVVFVGRQWEDARIAEAERSGLYASAALLRLAELSARHRDMSAGELAGNQEFLDRRERTRIQVDEALAIALDASRRWTTSRISGLRKDLRECWRALSQGGAGDAVSLRDSFRSHTALVQRELELLDEIVSVSRLALDPEPVAHYLIVAALEQQPLLGELLSQLRGVGTETLTRPTFAPSNARLIVTMLANRRRMFDTGVVQLQHAGEADPAVLRALAPHMDRARITFDRTTALIEAELEDDEQLYPTWTAHVATVAAALEAQSALADATFAILYTRLQVRADAAWHVVRIAIAIGAVLLLLNSWLVGSIIRSIRSQLAQREAERATATRSSAFLSMVLEAAPDAVVIVDAAGAIELVSSRVETAFGYTRDELLGKPAHVLFPEVALLRHTGASLAGAGGARDGRVTAVECSRRDGTRFPVELGVSPVEIAGARHLIVVGRDMTERRAMERQIQHSQRMDSIGQLTGGLAHDFNNLLGVIVGNLDLLERHVKTNEQAVARVRTAQRAAMRGSDLTRHLLAFARRQQLDPQPTPVNQMIGELLEMLPRTLGPEIKITTKLAAELPTATVDAAALESALLNLALNARDAMPGGGTLTIATTLVELDHEYRPVKTGELEAGSYIQITVADTGHGMSQDTVGKVFEPFFTTKPRGKGTGLGLAMVYGFVKQSRGNIRIYSEVDVGTTFTIYLPRADADAAIPPAHAATPRAMPAEGSLRGTVLVVDDDVDLLEIAVSYCEELGLRVLYATDGPSALEVVAEVPHLDLLLTDVVMPGLNGVALAAQLRARYPGLKVAYCSGFPSSALAERSQLRVDGPLIHKPYLKNAFVHAVTDALTSSTTATEEHAA